MKRKLVIILLAGALCISSLTGCSLKSNANESSTATQTATTDSVTTLLDTSDLFTERDYETDYEEEECTQITLDDENTICEDDSVSVDDQTVTINGEGTYLITGTLTNGSIVINAEKSDKIHLIFNNVSITNENGAAVEIQQAKKVFLTLEDGTTNEVVSNFEENDTDSNVDAAIFSKENLTLNGTGSLAVTSGKHGIVSKDDLVVTGGTYTITAQKQGLSGKDSIRIADGNFTITSGTDAIHSEYTSDSNSDSAEVSEEDKKGFVYIAGGGFTISSQGDGISSSYVTQLDGGEYNIITGGGSANAQTKADQQPVPPQQRESNSGDSVSEDTTTSTKAIKGAGSILINDGTYTIDSCDDGIHSNENVIVNGGQFTISTGDDGVHADDACTIKNGSIDITKSYEGIEGHQIYLAGGTISVVSSDDGLNAAGDSDNTENVADTTDTSGSSEEKDTTQDVSGQEMSTPGQNGPGGMGGMDEVDEEAEIIISGGELNLDAAGDGIDSNGDLHVTGGTIYVTGPSDNGNGALDYAGSADITGGTIVAVGMSGMAQNFGEDSTQGSMLINQDSTQNGAVTLTDNDGNVLVSYTPSREYNSVVISCAGLEEGSTYTLTTGSESAEVTMSSLVYSEGQSQNAPGQNGQGQGGPENDPNGSGNDQSGPGQKNDGNGSQPPQMNGQPDNQQKPEGTGESAQGENS